MVSIFCKIEISQGHLLANSAVIGPWYFKKKKNVKIKCTHKIDDSDFSEL